MGRGNWGGGGSPHLTPQGGPYLSGILPKTLVATLVPGSGEPGQGVKLY